jgi:hypothetical protein
MKHVILGVLLIAVGATVAPSQVDTTRTRKPSYPDSMKYPESGSVGTPSTSSVVKRAVISSGIANHEPMDSLSKVPSTTGKVFFFTEIVGMEGKTITHRWIKDGSKVADIRISVASNNYRCHSSRSVSGKSGYWSVQVLDADGKKLREVAFTVGNPAGETPLGMH